MERLLSFLLDRKIAFEERVSLKKKTWIKTGGECACWINPHTVEELTEVGRYLYSNKIPFEVVGHTSNIFFHSTYLPQVVVSTVKVCNYEIDGDVITCDCGVPVVKLAKECLASGYAGFYGLVGLPGTVAASVYGNAGCFDCSISSMLDSVDVLLPDGSVRSFSKEACGFAKRSSIFKRKEASGMILSVKLKVTRAEDIEEEKEKSEKTVLYRRTKQEKPSWCLGSVYGSMAMKHNARNVVALIVGNLMGVLHISTKRKAMKRTLLSLYGFRDLNPYVSDYNVNTFIWRDEDAERMFDRYKHFMSKVFNHLVLEIEERI